MKGYEVEKLGEVCDFIGGSQPPKSTFVYDLSEVDENEYVRLIQIRDYKSDRHIVYIPTSSTKKFCTKDDVMIGRYGPPVFQILKGLGGAYNVALMKAVPKTNELDKDYLFKFLASPDVQQYIIKLSERAAGQTGVNKAALHDYPIYIPPIVEQKRIVVLLDQTFVEIEKARVKTEQNLKNARELFDSSLQNIFKSRGESWERVSLLELLDRKWIVSHLDGNHGGDYPKKSEFVESGVPYISAKCLVSGEIDMNKAKYLSKEKAASLRKGIAKDEDVLFAHNATVGPVAILETDEEKVVLGTSLTYYRCNKDYILPEYLAQYMISYEFTSQYTSIMRQSTRNQVPITKQREFIHVIPPIIEQEDIAKIFVNLSNQLKCLEKIYLKKLVALEELKKSILQKAFAGELTKNESKGAAA